MRLWTVHLGRERMAHERRGLTSEFHHRGLPYSCLTQNTARAFISDWKLRGTVEGRGFQVSLHLQILTSAFSSEPE